MKTIDWDIIAPPRPAYEDLSPGTRAALEAEAKETTEEYIRRLYREQN